MSGIMNAIDTPLSPSHSSDLSCSLVPPNNCHQWTCSTSSGEKVRNVVLVCTTLNNEYADMQQ